MQLPDIELLLINEGSDLAESCYGAPIVTGRPGSGPDPVPNGSGAHAQALRRLHDKVHQVSPPLSRGYLSQEVLIAR